MKNTNIRHIHGACLFTLALFGCSTQNPPTEKVINERSTDLGYGFRQVVRDILVKGGEKGIDHFRYLYFKDELLSKSDSFSIAPSGEFAIYREPSTGIVYLYTAKGQKRSKLSELPIDGFTDVRWNEEIRKVSLKPFQLTRHMEFKY